MNLRVDHRPKCKTVTLLGENLREFGLHKGFLDMIPKAPFMKETNHTLDFI